jgi:HEAT repeat protein
MLGEEWSGGWPTPEFAARALREIGDVQAVEPLIAVLGDPYIGGRAVEALARIHDDRAFEPLVRYSNTRTRAAWRPF